jgi:hypothetical protein
MAAISFVGSSGVANGLAQGTSAVVTKPVGVVDGDQLLVFVSIGHTGTITAPAGWVEQSLGTNTVGTTLQCRLYKKTASSEPASWTWTFTSAAYVTTCWAGRGVGVVYNAAQNADGVSLTSHTTPSLTTPDNAWLVSSWTGRNLLALGWTPSAGDSERQDLTGGLLILLNVSHAVDDTNGTVVAGTYSKTATTLLSTQALNALVVLAPLLDIALSTPIMSPLTFGTESVELTAGISPAITSPMTTGSMSVELTVTESSTSSPVAFGIQVIELTADIAPFPAPFLAGPLELIPEPVVLTLEPIVAPTVGADGMIILGQVAFMDVPIVASVSTAPTSIVSAMFLELGLDISPILADTVLPRSMMYVVYAHSACC